MANLSLRQPVANTAPREGYARIHGLHHWAFRCKDADETRHFYEEILGLPLAAAVHGPTLFALRWLRLVARTAALGDWPWARPLVSAFGLVVVAWLLRRSARAVGSPR